MNSKPSSYSGNGPYAFVSYSHQDSHIVYPVIEQLVRQGYNVWYDNGIPLVSDYGGVLYDRIKNCSVFVLFVSLNSVQSEDVAKEAAHAISFKKPIVQVIIDENAELPPSIAFHLPRTQQYLTFSCEPKEFYAKLTDTLSVCRGLNESDNRSDAQSVSFGTPSLKTGDSLTFGRFRWLVLQTDFHRALLISEQAIVLQKYHEKWLVGTNWADCTLRQWLNGKFLTSSFTVDERKRILTVTNHTPNHEGIEYDDPTEDRVFCLSIDEAEKYFSDSAQRIVYPTDAAKSSLIFAPSGACRWWLRTTGHTGSHAACIDSDGQIISRGIDVNDGRTFVRPAIYISI